MFTPAVERPWRDAWPLAARSGDGNPWTTGVCWLFCRRTGVAVLWVGSVTTPGATGDVYACGPCLAELDHMVRAQAHDRERDGDGEGSGDHGDRTARAAGLTVRAHVPPSHPPSSSHPPSPPSVGGSGTCEHRRTEHRVGKTYCRGCGRQLYL
ncbi:hypothetical protein LUX12_04805 [Streptomyces somaliensis]|uniref:hypothetical protein n=1 Tax=Streptomyces somaliensis TaxID=78355 RepID=UPI0020CE40F1|nr:hypothetical protein [Streptomyces somaliensis]MCP9944262.1 hypothetical protein [Streptomyces somaliensis]MCP9962501.1 hypothetical protein [Streptomyces somaliensis]MCP9975328.1 hypothetical protein [Streptomyces somaliensis]